MKRSRQSMVMAVLAFSFVAGVVHAESDLTKFPLAKAIPADVFIGVASRGNADRTFLKQYWHEVFVELHSVGVIDDVWELITDNLPESRQQEAEELREKFGRLCLSVDWCGLFSKEMIFAGRLKATVTAGSPFEGLWLGRMDKDSAATNYKSLKSLLDESAKLINSMAEESAVTVSESTVDGAKICKLGPKSPPAFGISVGYQKDLIFLTLFDDGLLKEALGLLAGDSDKPRLTESKRFAKAFAELPTPEDKLVFFDVATLNERIGGYIELAKTGAEHGRAAAKAKHRKVEASKKAKAADADAEDDSDEGAENRQPKKSKKADKDDGAESGDKEEGAGEDDATAEVSSEGDEGQWIGLVSNLLKDMSVFDYMATVERTEGHRVLMDSFTTLKKDAKSSPLYKVLTGGKGVSDFQKWVPKEADSFACWSNWDWVGLYRYGIDMLKQHVKEAEGMLTMWEGKQEELGINLEKDILSLLSGPKTQVQVGKDVVFVIKVPDQQKAARQINRFLDKLTGTDENPGAITVTPVKIAGEKGFKEINIPMMAMMGGGMSPPVVGCAEGCLIVGTRAASVAKCLRTARDQNPNILENARFKKEGLMPKSGEVSSISFTDQSNRARQIQDALTAVASGLGFVGLFGGQNMPPEARNVMAALPPILGKLGQVGGKMDFYLSSATCETFDGQGWHDRTVQNYKSPEDLKKERLENGTASEEGEKAGAEQSDTEKAAKTKSRKAGKAEDADDEEQPAKARKAKPKAEDDKTDEEGDKEE